ncbi:MAG: RNA chaperone Hfq [Acidobacteria bacterium]|nr:MAG: RNA chaperone Hfq [Acidobacteriota bacterium]TDI47224.1 MAG: RNA chaperone Hfq [Acidobacteriota bacterium]
MDEGASPNIQNEFFNQARREKRRLAVFLNTGRRLTGRIRSFDKFTILLETAQGEQIVFKHAISTVGPVVVPARPRPREAFNNRMEFARGRKGESSAPAVKPAPGTPDEEPGGSEESGEGSAPTS